MNKSTHSIVTYCIYFLFAILVLYPLLEFLNTLPLYLWDESRQAANAIEMFTNHNWLVTYYNGSPDMWNTKPPLLIWLQVLSMHIFGLTTSALRAPSVIAAFATILSLFFFLKKETNNIWIAFFSGIVVVALPGFNGYHVARTGDYDSLLILFMIQCAIQFYYYIETKNRIHIILFGLFLTLGSLTKGIAPLLFLPGFLVYAFFQKKIYAILKDPYFYISCIGYLVIIGSYYILREHENNGYLRAVYENELGGRFLEVKENHNGDLFFYLNQLLFKQTYFWFGLFLVCLITYPFIMNTFNHKKLFNYFLLLIICFFVIINSSKTFLTWYVAPLLPLIACICILLLYNIFTQLFSKTNWPSTFQYGLGTFLIGVLTSISYIDIVLTNRHPTYENSSDYSLYRLSRYFDGTENSVPTNLKIINHTDIQQHLYFYIQRLQLSDVHIDYGDYMKLITGDTVIVADDMQTHYIRSNYSTNELYNKNNVWIFAIK